MARLPRGLQNRDHVPVMTSLARLLACFYRGWEAEFGDINGAVRFFVAEVGPDGPAEALRELRLLSGSGEEARVQRVDAETFGGFGVQPHVDRFLRDLERALEIELSAS